MNTDMRFKSLNQLPESAREIAQQATVDAQNVAVSVENMVKDTYQSMLSKIDDEVDHTKGYAQKAVEATKEKLAISKEYVRRYPVPVVLGAVAFGISIGYMLLVARRKQTFGERYVDEPFDAVRGAFLGALAPVAQGVHKGFDSVRHDAEKAIDRVRSFVPIRNDGSLSQQIERFGNNLKFW